MKERIEIKLEFDKKVLKRKLIEAIVEDVIRNLKKPFGFLYRTKVENITAEIIEREFPSEYEKLRKAILQYVENKRFIRDIVRKIAKEIIEEKLREFE